VVQEGNVCSGCNWSRCRRDVACKRADWPSGGRNEEFPSCRNLAAFESRKPIPWNQTQHILRHLLFDPQKLEGCSRTCKFGESIRGPQMMYYDESVRAAFSAFSRPGINRRMRACSPKRRMILLYHAIPSARNFPLSWTAYRVRGLRGSLSPDGFQSAVRRVSTAGDVATLELADTPRPTCLFNRCNGTLRAERSSV